MTTHTAEQIDAPARRKLQRSWYFYDWAVSAYDTTVGAVLLGPYLTALAKADACPNLADGETCRNTVNLLGFNVLPGAVAPLAATITTIDVALMLPVVGAMADRSSNPRFLLGIFAWIGTAATLAMLFATGSNWQLLVALQAVAGFAVAASAAVYDSILIMIATPDERDRVSSRGWAFGYLAGFLLLAANLAMVSAHDALGLSEGAAVRVSLMSAGAWWGLFTLIPFLGLRHMPARILDPQVRRTSLIGGSFGQLAITLKHLAGYRNTWMFLLAALLFNDGAQTVIGNASLYGQEELGLTTQQLMLTILLVQFVAFFGALLFGNVAGRIGAKRAILVSLALWALVSLAGMALPHGQFGPFLGLAFFIGLVLGGTRALARALFSQLIPQGREAEYFSLYQAMERGTSWFGTLVFAWVYQLSGSYRPSLASLVVFFVLGAILLMQVNVRRGIEAAGNAVPKVI